MTMSNRLVRDFCSVVESRSCKAPACGGKPDRLIPICFACGEPACTECSIRTLYFDYGVQRICIRCVEDHTRGTPLQPKAEAFLDWFLNERNIYPSWYRGVKALRSYLSRSDLTQKAREQAKRDLYRRLDAKPKRVPRPKFAIVYQPRTIPNQGVSNA